METRPLPQKLVRRPWFTWENVASVVSASDSQTSFPAASRSLVSPRRRRRGASTRERAGRPSGRRRQRFGRTRSVRKAAREPHSSGFTSIFVATWGAALQSTLPRIVDICHGSSCKRLYDRV
ncbi:hypothetical protein LX36DRAFT_230290 [Colletotrichum falcatum]|nr:hypothetical protein LX36DRAFT_230290 [Colletotrichum falcatum]